MPKDVVKPNPPYRCGKTWKTISEHTGLPRSHECGEEVPGDKRTHKGDHVCTYCGAHKRQ